MEGLPQQPLTLSLLSPTVTPTLSMSFYTISIVFLPYIIPNLLSCKPCLSLFSSVLSTINHNTYLHLLHPTCTIFFTSLVHCPVLIWTVHIYLHYIFFLPLSRSHSHMYSVLFSLTFIRLFSRAYLHLSSVSSTFCLLSLQIIIPFANIIVHKDSYLTPSFNLSITLQTRHSAAPSDVAHFAHRLQKDV